MPVETVVRVSSGVTPFVAAFSILFVYTIALAAVDVDLGLLQLVGTVAPPFINRDYPPLF